MISNLRPEIEDFQAKQEGDDQNTKKNQTLVVKPQSSTTSSSRQWGSAFRNPRIVRASRCFGGKDRHSKVCTVRGLRDRRIRLSVPTAVQLYDLQDRLGLNQPSKVVDWLLDAAKDDVDKLPPLQFPQGFDRLYPNMAFGVHDHSQNWDNFSSSLDVDQVSSRQDLEIGGSSLRPRNYKDEEKLDIFGLEKGKWIKEGNDDEHDDHHPQHHDNDNISMEQSSRDKSHTGLFNHPTMAYNPYDHHLDPSHLSLSQLGNNSCLPQLDVSLNTRSNPNMLYPVMNSILPSGSSQLFLYPPTTTNISTGFPAYPSFVMAQLGDGNENVRRLNQLFQLSNSNPQRIVWSSNNMRPFHHLMNVNPGFEDMHRNRSNDNDDNNDSNNV